MPRSLWCFKGQDGNERRGEQREVACIISKLQGSIDFRASELDSNQLASCVEEMNRHRQMEKNESMVDIDPTSNPNTSLDLILRISTTQRLHSISTVASARFSIPSQIQGASKY